MATNDIEIHEGDVVSKGYEDYLAITEPKEGIFQARNTKGETVTLAVHEVLKSRVEG
jgi:hypothetical protein